MSNFNSKNLWMAGAILGGFILLLVGLILVFNAFAFRIGTIDTDRIIKESSFSQGINKDLQAKGKELSAKLQSAKTEAEKNKINLEFQSYQAEKTKMFSERLKKITVEVAKKKGVKAVTVYSTQGFIYSETDLTDAVIVALDK